MIARGGLRVVVGLGKTGVSCVRYLKQQGYAVAVTDSRSDPPGLDAIKAEFPDLNITTGKFDESLLLQAEEIILSPGVALNEPALREAINKGISVVGDVELFCRQISAPIVAITGSNAKSTTTTLVYQMAKDAGIDVEVGGNIGVPVLDLLQRPQQAQLYVLELSSFQLETTHSLRAAAATVLNVSEDHMDRYTDMNQYRMAKQRIYRGCKQAIFNRQDMLTAPLLPPDIPQVSFGLDKPDVKQFGLIEKDNEKWLAYFLQPLLPARELKIKGAHNTANALAALALGQAVGIPMPSMLASLRAFAGLPHRAQFVANIGGVDYFNDSKGTNVGATLAAIEGIGTDIGGKILLLAGGQGKGQDFAPLAPACANYVRCALLFGQDADKLAATLQGQVACKRVPDLQQAVAQAQQLAQAGDAVLLSPACASLDMFKNYEDRGNQFVAAVKLLSTP